MNTRIFNIEYERWERFWEEGHARQKKTRRNSMEK